MKTVEIINGTLKKCLALATIGSVFFSNWTAMAGCGATPVPPGNWSGGFPCEHRDAPYCAMAPLSMACIENSAEVPTSRCYGPDGQGGWSYVYYNHKPTYSPGSCAG